MHRHLCYFDGWSLDQIPKKVGIIFDYILNSKQAVTTFMPIHTNLENNIAIYSATTPVSSTLSASSISSLNQIVTPTNENPIQELSHQNVEYSKYLVVKIDNYPLNKHNDLMPTNSTSTLMATSAISTATTLSSSSSSSSLHTQGLNKHSKHYIQQYQKVLPAQEALATAGTSLVRLVCYYLCVNKTLQNPKLLPMCIAPLQMNLK